MNNALELLKEQRKEIEILIRYIRKSESLGELDFWEDNEGMTEIMQKYRDSFRDVK